MEEAAFESASSPPDRPTYFLDRKPAVDPTPISVDLASKATASGAEAKVEARV